MKLLRNILSFLFALSVLSCVTINVYFPAAAAEEAADQIIRDVYGETPEEGENPASEPHNGIEPERVPALIALLERLVPPAHAEADISIKTPAIQRITASLEKRHKQLAPYYSSGAIGMTNDGLITIRDQKLVPLKDRSQVKQLVNTENRDRDALYKEIARANGHPEWEPDIRKTFARRWVGNAPGGWWYNDNQGNWKQK